MRKKSLNGFVLLDRSASLSRLSDLGGAFVVPALEDSQ